MSFYQVNSKRSTNIEKRKDYDGANLPTRSIKIYVCGATEAWTNKLFINLLGQFPK